MMLFSDYFIDGVFSTPLYDYFVWFDDEVKKGLQELLKYKYGHLEITIDEVLVQSNIFVAFQEKDYFISELIKTMDIQYNILDRAKAEETGNNTDTIVDNVLSVGVGSTNGATNSTNNDSSVSFDNPQPTLDSINEGNTTITNTSSSESETDKEQTNTGEYQKTTVDNRGVDYEEIIAKRREIIDVSVFDILATYIVNAIAIKITTIFDDSEDILWNY